MRKFIISTVAAAALVAASAPAFAGYTTCGIYGCVYVPTCVQTIYGVVCG